MEKSLIYEIKNIDNLILRTAFNIFKNDCNKCTSELQREIVTYLYYNPVSYQKDLEKEFGVRRSTISGILKTMEKNNLIKKVDNPYDCRSKQIILNEEIKSMYFQLQNKYKDIEGSLVNNISVDDLITFYDVIDKIKINLDLLEKK